MRIADKVGALAKDDRGLSTVEYIVLLVLIVAASVGMWNQFGGSVVGKLTKAKETFDSGVTQDPGAGQP